MVHSAVPGHYMRDREPHRSRVNAVRDTLKRLNFSRFGTMLEAFRYYDQVKKNKKNSLVVLTEKLYNLNPPEKIFSVKSHQSHFFSF